MDFCPPLSVDGLSDGLPQASPLFPPYLGPLKIEDPNNLQYDYPVEASPLFSEGLISHGTIAGSLQHASQLSSLASWSTTDPTVFLGDQGWHLPQSLSWLAQSLEHGQQLLKMQPELALPLYQCGANVPYDQLLVYDALPAPQTDGDQGFQNGMMVEPIDHTDFRVVNSLSPDHMRSQFGNQYELLCQPPIPVSIDQVYQENSSSPGSAASSSVVNETETCDRSFPSDWCNITSDTGINVPVSLSQGNVAGTTLNSHSWLNSSQAWITNPPVCQESIVERSLIPALTALRHNTDIEPPIQRRKLQGITMEQLLQAEQLQQAATAMNAIENVFTPHVRNNMEKSPTRMNSANLGRSSSINAELTSKTSPNERRNSIQRPPVATSVEPQSIAARHRRKRIRDRKDNLSLLIPGAARLDTAAMFELAIKYVHFLEAQMQCLENEVSISTMSTGGEDTVVSFKRALIHRLLSSQDIQHFLAREGLCLVTESQAACLNFDPNSIVASASNRRTFGRGT